MATFYFYASTIVLKLQYSYLTTIFGYYPIGINRLLLNCCTGLVLSIVLHIFF